MIRNSCARIGSPLLIVVTLLLFTAACRKTPPATSSAETTAGPTAVPTPAGTLDLTRVQGSWMRQDGGYRLVIGEISESGHAKGEYFNPNPIKVAWTNVRAEGGVIKVDLELRDTNYPGCLYKLTFDAAGDRLVGTYFQAQLQETYEIAFVRN